MTLFILSLHVIVCLVLIVVVLLQRGKGAEVGAMFGGGGANTMFGGRGAGSFLTRLTTGAAVIFMVTSLALAFFAQRDRGTTLFDEPAAESPAGDAEPDAGFEEVPTEGGFEEVPPAEAQPEPTKAP